MRLPPSNLCAGFSVLFANAVITLMQLLSPDTGAHVRIGESGFMEPL